jgi:glucosyl-dolichyl phosphate glucuronosyltransferase
MTLPARARAGRETATGGTRAAAVEDFSVIICTYTEERWESLVEAIDSVRNQTLPALQIIVVIDHCGALSRRVSAELASVTPIENQYVPGLSGARNSGLALARGSVVAFLDDDAVASPEWLAELAAGYRDATVIGVGGSIDPIWDGGRPMWFPPEFDWVVGCTYRGLPTGPAPVRNLLGCNMSFRRSVFDGVGGFRTGLGRVGTHPLGCEETELCIRLKRCYTGRVLLYQPRAKVWQRVPRQRACFEYFLSRCFAEGFSKALISRLVGVNDGLASERAHVMSALPAGMLAGLREAALGRRASGLARAGAIAAGLGTATAGYARGLLSQKLPPARPWSVLNSLGSHA